MIRVFLDANVYFSAARSKSGASAAILEIAKLKQITVLVTRTILREAERNIRLKEFPYTRLRFYEIVTKIKPTLITIDKKQAEKRYLKVINRKDTYVLEGARKAKVEYLVTLDKKHFFSKKLRNISFPFQIVTPGQLIRIFASK